jgi:hypothetical protein
VTLTPHERHLIAAAIRAGRNLSDLAEDFDVPDSVIREIAAERSGPRPQPGDDALEQAARSGVVAALEPLDPDARARVLRWARDRYVTTATTSEESQPR